jgi:hypothetical protein
MWQGLKESKLVSYGSLFTSFGTLICCAIPSTLVLLGFGAGVAGFVSDFPQLIWLSENKGIVFGVSFFMLGLSYFSQRYAENLSCPIDKKEDCTTTRSWSKKLLIITAVINAVGATYAFVLPRLL